ncbi:hypothetical protein JIN85_20450 [Luteolibacter pohnpeiensis]|uniref:GspD-like N0 domain-containing protein n=1 Tax=Luteolibacter pohnpeiensis TaxID=454153 RepID=A0A934S9X4_9BACT|nr:hypothetical protein [Luteolibacter pohnpeiensis]MBK1884792.1 hypothetical protein [Luteolibacter pohnpeiensis]
MKTILIAIWAIVVAAPIRGDQEVPKIVSDFIFPRTDFSTLLEFVAKIANKTVVVPSEDELKLQTSLVLPGPIPKEKLRKVIESLLILEGFELVETKDELLLTKVLTEEQCAALNTALGRERLGPEDLLPRRRIVPRGPGEPEPRQWVVVRPPKNKIPNKSE